MDNIIPGINQGDIRILLSCLSLKEKDKIEDLLSQLSSDQWQLVVNIARCYRVSPLLFFQLKKMQVNLPHVDLQRLEQDYHWNLARNIRLYHELNVILKQMQMGNIPVILLKGLYLADAIYDNIGLRPMTDMDILIHHEDLEKAIILMKENGYFPERSYWSDVDGNLHFHAPVMAKNRLFLEIHWNLSQDSNQLQLNIDDIWERAQIYTFQGTPVFSLHPSHQLLHLAIHASYGHQFKGQFLSLVDLTEFINKYRSVLDWTEINSICREWRAERGTFLSLQMAHDLIQAMIPKATLERLKSGAGDKQVTEWAKVILFNTSPVLSENYIDFMEGTSIVMKIHGLLRGLIPSRKVMAIEYRIPVNEWKLILKYPRHILSKIVRYWKPFTSRISGDIQQAQLTKNEKALRDWLGGGKEER